MKLMKDMNRDELIELVAAVSLRVLAFTYAFFALQDLATSTWSCYMNSYLFQELSNSQHVNHYPFAFYIGQFLEFLLEIAKSIIFFVLAVPLARLVTRGLSHALEPKLSE
jgi:hypothetical protein